MPVRTLKIQTTIEEMDELIVTAVDKALGDELAMAAGKHLTEVLFEYSTGDVILTLSDEPAGGITVVHRNALDRTIQTFQLRSIGETIDQESWKILEDEDEDTGSQGRT